jgi:hypothetical protein
VVLLVPFRPLVLVEAALPRVEPEPELGGIDAGGRAGDEMANLDRSCLPLVVRPSRSESEPAFREDELMLELIFDDDVEGLISDSRERLPFEVAFADLGIADAEAATDAVLSRAGRSNFRAGDVVKSLLSLPTFTSNDLDDGNVVGGTGVPSGGVIDAFGALYPLPGILLFFGDGASASLAVSMSPSGLLRFAPALTLSPGTPWIPLTRSNSLSFRVGAADLEELAADAMLVLLRLRSSAFGRFGTSSDLLEAAVDIDVGTEEPAREPSSFAWMGRSSLSLSFFLLADDASFALGTITRFTVTAAVFAALTVSSDGRDGRPCMGSFPRSFSFFGAVSFARSLSLSSCRD